METTSTGKSTAPLSELLPHHYEHLLEGGLSDETIRTAGLYSESDHIKLGTMLGCRYSQKNGPAIVFPYDIAFARVRPDRPPEFHGKPAKYLSPTGAGARVYMPPILNGELHDVGRVLLVTEGEKKALAIAQAGYVVVGLGGVDCWHIKNSSALLIELESLPWRSRQVRIVFDSDAAENEKVADQARLLAATLATKGAIVKVVRIPAGPNGEKVGADDFIVAHGVVEFHKLVNAAEEPEAVSPDEIKSPANRLLPEKEAESIIAGMKQDGVNTLAFWRDAVLRYRDGAYRELPEAELRARVTVLLNARSFSVGQHAVGDITAQVKLRPNRWSRSTRNRPPGSAPLGRGHPKRCSSPRTGSSICRRCRRVRRMPSSRRRRGCFAPTRYPTP